VLVAGVVQAVGLRQSGDRHEVSRGGPGARGLESVPVTLGAGPPSRRGSGRLAVALQIGQAYVIAYSLRGPLP
jgi:hypothetical protein